MAQAFYGLMSRLEFLPNSPTLMNAGRDLQQLSACFVLPVEDSLESIFETVKQTALIHQSGGGTGFSFSRLRPRNDRVLTTNGIASGPLSFMRVYNLTTEVIKQGGTRRGANMGVLRVDHPDILDFIRVKEDPREFTNFNLSVGLTDAFMSVLKENRPFALVNPRTGHRVRRISPQVIFDQIVEQAWRVGDPGLLFLDRINADHPTPQLGEIEATNPCGEQPLLPYEACTLGSINLSRMLRRVAGGMAIDYEKLERVTRLAVHFLDNVIDVNRYPLPQIKEMSWGNRKIGLGVMGFADLLIRLGIPYDSEEALKVAERVMSYVREKAQDTSVSLARERGAFPNFQGSRLERSGQPRVRNATRTTVAPTGTLSLIAGCSSGIEPLYGVAYTRLAMDDTHLIEVNPTFVQMAKRRGFYSEAVMRKVTETGSVRGLREVPLEIQRLFVTAHEISPEFHVRIQAAFQRYTENAVSKTINFPQEATQKDVAKAFLLAYEESCKGITVYRSGSRERQVLSCSNAQYC
jgi:ribonucleoside-diphosphate reductase alpha chain